MNLAALQGALQARVLARPAASDSELVVAQSPEEAAERLAIYTNAYSVRLTNALAATFPGVQRSLGAEAFAALTAQFSRDLPSRYRSVRDFGDALPAYLASAFRGVKGRGLRELAQWEWLLADAFDAADEDERGVNLSAAPPEEWPSLRFEFSSSLRCIDLTTNALSWRRATDASGPVRWRKLKRRVHYAIWRRNLEVYFRAMDEQEALALDAARAGATFGGVCERLLASAPQSEAALEASALRAARLLQSWVRDRWLVRVHQP